MVAGVASALTRAFDRTRAAIIAQLGGLGGFEGAHGLATDVVLHLAPPRTKQIRAAVGDTDPTSGTRPHIRTFVRVLDITLHQPGAFRPARRGSHTPVVWIGADCERTRRGWTS